MPNTDCMDANIRDLMALDRVYLDQSRLNEARIEEHDLVQRYLRKELEEAELAAFEAYVIANPRMVAAIEEQEMINAAFRSLQPVLRRDRSAFRRYWSILLPLAACLALAFVLMPSSEPVTAERTLRIEFFRGASDMHAVSGREKTMLVIDVGPQLDGVSAYDLRMLDGSGMPVAGAASLNADAEGWLRYMLDAGSMPAGIYEVQVHDAAGKAVRRFTLQVD